MRGHLLGLFVPEAKKRMFVEDLCVLIAFCQFLVERFKECLEALHIRVAGSLRCNQADEWTASILFRFVGVYVLISFWDSRSTPRKRQPFDSTKGYPGEDVAVQSSLSFCYNACCTFFPNLFFS